jgi:hypothetical protein
MVRAILAQIQHPKMLAFPKELTWEELGKKLSQALQLLEK